MVNFSYWLNAGSAKDIKRRIQEKFFGHKPVQGKIELIDWAFSQYDIGSFADFGGVWGVHGLYSLYMLENYPIENAYLVDNHFTGKITKKSEMYPQLNLVKGDFREKSTIEKVKKVDLMIFFDVLLHQVNWKEILMHCAGRTDCFAIYNPQFPGNKTVRLLDLGEEEYFKTIPHTKKGPYYEDLFTEREDRDTPGVWQWGICDNDLVETFDDLNFNLEYTMNHEAWKGTPFRSKALLFRKKS